MRPSALIRTDLMSPMRAGERCEFVVAVRDGMTVDVSARFVPAVDTATPVEVLAEQRSITAQGSFEADQPGSLEPVLDNGFSWLTNKLVVLSLTQSTADQRRRVQEQHRAVVEAQDKRRKQEEAVRAEKTKTELQQAQSYIRCEELIQVRCEYESCCAPEAAVAALTIAPQRRVARAFAGSCSVLSGGTCQAGGRACAPRGLG